MLRKKSWEVTLFEGRACDRVERMQTLRMRSRLAHLRLPFDEIWMDAKVAYLRDQVRSEAQQLDQFQKGEILTPCLLATVQMLLTLPTL